MVSVEASGEGRGIGLDVSAHSAQSFLAHTSFIRFVSFAFLCFFVIAVAIINDAITNIFCCHFALC